jgi:hypothetical protein
MYMYMPYLLYQHTILYSLIRVDEFQQNPCIRVHVYVVHNTCYSDAHDVTDLLKVNLTLKQVTLYKLEWCRGEWV